MLRTLNLGPFASASPAPLGVRWLDALLTGAGIDTAGWPWPMLWLVQLFVFCCVAFHLLERFGPPVVPGPRPGPFLKGWRADIVGALVNGPALGYFTEIVAVSLVLCVPVLARPGLSTWPWAGQFALFFLCNDFGRYWLHRWHHASDLLWRFHRVHHTAREVGVLTNFRVHVFEAVPKYALLVLPFRMLGVDVWVLLTYSALDLVKGFWHHANVRLPVGRANLVLNSAEQHWWHHATDVRGQYANFGSVLSVWDRLFGTFFWPRGRWPERIGVRDMEAFPETYLGQFVSMLHPDEAFLSPSRSDAAAGQEDTGQQTTRAANT